MDEKRCKGCGVVLQHSNPLEMGYCVHPDHECCQRCFRLTHYNDVVLDLREKVDSEELKKIIREEEKALFVYVVDVLSLTDFFRGDAFSLLKDRHVAVFINKIDLLPRNAKMEKIEAKIVRYLRELRFHDFIFEGAFLTRKNDESFRALFREFLREKAFEKIVFIGSFNAGKSTLLNYLTDQKRFTTSIYPSTTLAVGSVEYDGIRYIDTPGTVDNGNFLMNLPVDYLKYFAIQHTIKPLVFQLHENQSYTIEDVFRLDVETKKPATVIFYFASDISIHRTRSSKVEEYLFRQKNDFRMHCSVKDVYCFKNTGKRDFEIPGLGFISVHGTVKATFHVPAQTKVWEREILL